MISNVTRTLVRQARREGTRTYIRPIPKPPSMNELPVPMNSWQEVYETNQKKFNMHLIGGILFSVGSVGLILANNWIDNKVFFAPK